jgi:ATP-dependent DNA ligase
MASALVREPFHRPGEVYEEKVDGWRIVAYKDGARVHLISRNGRDHTCRFADLAAASGSSPLVHSCWTARWRSTTSSSGCGSNG